MRRALAVAALLLVAAAASAAGWRWELVSREQVKIIVVDAANLFGEVRFCFAGDCGYMTPAEARKMAALLSATADEVENHARDHGH